MTSRRHFIQILPVAGATLLASRGAFAADPMVDEKTDATAKALAYVADATKADKAKYKAGSLCSNCQLFASKSADAGSCGLFQGKMVAAKGWCSAWQKKA
jgi:High potential iron-sulfur protein